MWQKIKNSSGRHRSDRFIKNLKGNIYKSRYVFLRYVRSTYYALFIPRSIVFHDKGTEKRRMRRGLCFGFNLNVA